MDKIGQDNTETDTDGINFGRERNSLCSELKIQLKIRMKQEAIVYLCKYSPRSQAFSLMRADYRVYAWASHHSHGVVASACAFLAYTGAHQVENIYKDEL